MNAIGHAAVCEGLSSADVDDFKLLIGGIFVVDKTSAMYDRIASLGKHAHLALTCPSKLLGLQLDHRHVKLVAELLPGLNTIPHLTLEHILASR